MRSSHGRLGMGGIGEDTTSSTYNVVTFTLVSRMVSFQQNIKATVLFNIFLEKNEVRPLQIYTTSTLLLNYTVIADLPS
jgi:hypothetical protein